jgi:hypothetical protein
MHCCFLSVNVKCSWLHRCLSLTSWWLIRQKKQNNNSRWNKKHNQIHYSVLCWVPRRCLLTWINYQFFMTMQAFHWKKQSSKMRATQLWERTRSSAELSHRDKYLSIRRAVVQVAIEQLQKIKESKKITFCCRRSKPLTRDCSMIDWTLSLFKILASYKMKVIYLKNKNRWWSCKNKIAAWESPLRRMK